MTGQRGSISRVIAGLMLVEAVTLAIASIVHFGVVIPLGVVTLDDPFAGAKIPEAIIAVVVGVGDPLGGVVEVVQLRRGEQGKADLQSPSGKMNQWLATDLAGVPRTKCVAVFSWDRRIYTAGDGNVGMQFNLLQATSIMESAGADILVSSKDKLYARFPLMSHLGVKDSTGGFRQFIVGTGGRSFDQMITPTATNPVEKQNGGAGGSFGVLKLTLDASSYSWEFIPIRAGGFTDSGGPVPCHTS